MEFLSKIGKQYLVKEVPILNFSSFEIFNQYESIKVLNSYEVSNGFYSINLSIVKYSVQYYQHRYVPGQGKDTSNYVFISFKMDCNFGVILLRPETIEDKISDFFKPIDIDFKDNKRFSNKYMVVSQNEKLARNFFNNNLLEYIQSIDNLILEINQKECLVRFNLLPLDNTDFSTIIEQSLGILRNIKCI